MFYTPNVSVKKITTVLHINRENRDVKNLKYNGHLRYYELILTISGENYTHFNGKTIHNIPGSVEYLPKGIEDAPNTVVDFVKCGDSIDIIFDSDSDLPKEAMVLNTHSNENIRKLFSNLSMLWVSGGDDEYCMYRCMSILYDIFAEFENVKKASPDAAKELITPAIEYMSKHFNESDFDCPCLGEICGMSYSYFRRIFTSVYKMPPVKYLTRMRINYACELLQNGAYSISDIATMSGYENIYYFSRVFRKETGLSPSSFKASQNSPYKGKD